MLLRDKVVMISGVGPGLGIQLARAAAAEGARLVLATLEEQELAVATAALERESPGTEVLALVNDIRDRERCRATVAAVAARFGRIDALVNSAYVPGAWEPIATADLAHWPQTLGTNLIGTLTLTQEVAGLMRHTGGSVVMINTMVVRSRPMAGNAEYDASKSALRSVTGNLAQELGAWGIRVNSVFMGWMWGPSVERHLAQQAAERGSDVATLRREVERDIPLGRMPTDAECARAALFFASDHACAVSGACLDVNGGQYIPR